VLTDVAAPLRSIAKPRGSRQINLPGSRRPHAPKGEAVNPAGVKVTKMRSWTHDPRFQCAPGEQPYGAGFSAVGVGCDVVTGMEWVPE